MKKLLILAASITALVLISGCSTATSGNKIENDKVSQIKKGVTTRTEVEALFGKPDSVSIMGDGRRMLFYNYTETSATANAIIPYAGIFMGDKRNMRRQTFQVILNKADIVEDYEYSDQASKTDINYIGGKVTTTKEAPAPATAK